VGRKVRIRLPHVLRKGDFLFLAEKESRRVPDRSSHNSRFPPEGTTMVMTVYDIFCQSNVVVFLLDIDYDKINNPPPGNIRRQLDEHRRVVHHGNLETDMRQSHVQVEALFKKLLLILAWVK